MGFSHAFLTILVIEFDDSSGWGHNMVCNKKYHFILPSKNMMAAFLNCGGNDEAVKSNLVELKGHIMHGVFHSNGFGHLLCLNGVETGSDLTGQHLMHFWDRLCTGLRARLALLFFIGNNQLDLLTCLISCLNTIFELICL